MMDAIRHDEILYRTMTMTARLCCLTALLLLAAGPATVCAAQLAGVPPPLPPGIDRKLQIYFANDVFSSGGNGDDFRTQQFSVTGEFARNWVAVFDQSLLTNEENANGNPQRIDQLSGSLGYTFLRQQDDRGSRLLQLGGGLRYSGKAGGARIQNGFHQLIGSEIKTMPYVDESRTDATLWALYRRDGLLADDVELPLVGGGWRFDYWGRASAMVTTDNAQDGNLTLNLVAQKRWFQAWFGVQADLRRGHNSNIVEQATADYEDGMSTVLGIRLGPFVFESERKLDGSGGFGYFSLTSRGEAITWPGSSDGFELLTTVTQPDVYAVVQGRFRHAPRISPNFTQASYWAVDLMYGRPQFDDRTDRFVETWQVALAREWSAKLAGYDWLQGYVSVGPGWRTENMVGEGMTLGGTESSSVSRVGVFGTLGLRFGTQTRRQDRRRLLLHFGLRGWLPTSAGNVSYAGETLRLQKPQLGADAGVVWVFR